MKLSFVIPCYGSFNTIEGVVDEIAAVMKQRGECEYEIIAVNDGSPDNVIVKLRELVKKYPVMRAVDLSKNMGKHAAVMAGYSLVTGDYVVNLDDDGQCPMDKLWELVDALGGDYDLAMAKYPEKKQSLFKNIGSGVNSMMVSWLLGKPRNMHFSNFSVMRRYIVDEMCRYNNPYPYIEGLILRTTKRIVCVEMEERGRADGGKGNFTFRKSFSLLINGLTAFSEKPLRIASFIGALCALGGFAMTVYVVINRLMHPDVPLGYSSIMAAVFFIGGVIMMMLGLIGEYIGRIYISLNNSPQYVIREIYSSEENSPQGKEK